jgi:hypothetical protein
MKYTISKSRFNGIIKKIFITVIGDIKTGKFEDGDYIELYDKYGNNFADIWLKGSSVTKKKCKKTISFYLDASETIENFIPIMRKKEFSKGVIDYVYNQTGIKCDCVEFQYSITDTYDDSGEYSGVDSKTYNYRKK